MVKVWPGARKAALTAHVAASVGWFGAVVVFLVLAVVAVGGRDVALVRACYVALDLVARLVVVPFAVASVVTGLVSSWVSPWGLVRHWWVVVKLVVTLAATGVLLLQVAPTGALADVAVGTGFPNRLWSEARASLVVHAAGGLLVLLAMTVLAVFKPRGVTRYGARRRAVPTFGYTPGVGTDVLSGMGHRPALAAEGSAATGGRPEHDRRAGG
ncbi:DUF2269 domain-containing protein [Micromonospora sp. U21]|uniref:DUF2269 domain-containing protein n=1 Tax=Micromonospora sp. U21 TaxID=2824899 RepID=UPI001B3836CB|nr:DUF2269 domain-containing protein [Micromonospora sp. U21]MBQ0905588.1 DUF2269 domain-containing protein [Micromonospora sp. U21]